MKTLVFCVIYPGLPDFVINDYVESIVRQKDQKFDWLIINDKCGDEQLRLFPKNAKFVHVKSCLSFGKVREIGILYAIEKNYDCVMFTDIDDFYADNRVGASKLCLEKNDFVFTEIQVVDFEKKPIHRNLMQSLQVNPAPATISDILDYNYIGLSHSAVRTSALKDFEISENIEVVDWWIFSLLLIERHAGRFMPEVNTFYRQSDNNYVGVFNRLDFGRLQRGIDVKLNHYAGLGNYCAKRQLTEMHQLFNKRYREMLKLREAIQDSVFAQKYIKKLNYNFNAIYKGWWSEIVSLEKWGQL